jgi:ribonuclease HI
MIACNHSDAKLWLIELQESMGHESFVKLIVTPWSIWWVRRKAVHEEQFQSPLTTFLFIQRYMLDL